MKQRKYISTSILEYLSNKNKVYRGIGKVINKTYGGSDDGMGTFWTDNLTMAKWFAGLIEFNCSTEKYEPISNNGEILEKTLSFKNPYIINSTDEDYDSFQQYMDEIETSGGVEKYKQNLIDKNHDGIILKNNTTNYYEDGTYDIYIEFNTKDYLKSYNESIINVEFNNLEKFLGRKISNNLLNQLSKIDNRIYFITKEEFNNSYIDLKTDNSIVGMIGEDVNNNTLIYIVIDTMVHPIFNEITRRELLSTIKHELIHFEQRKRRNFKGINYDYKKQEDYYKNTDEIMAISYSIVTQLIDYVEIYRHQFYFVGHNKDDYFKSLKILDDISPSYNFIKNKIGGKVLKKYDKYIYQYLKEYVDKIID